MIYLLHGENIQASRNALVQLKEKHNGKEVRELVGRELDETKLTQALESTSLFGADIVVVIENLFSHLGGRKTKLLEKYTEILKQASGDVVIWEGKEISKAVVGALGKNVRVEEFKIPVVIFQLLDGLRPRATKNILHLLDQAITVDAPELLHVMLARRLRELIMITNNVTPPGAQSWQLGRLTTQSKYFTIEELTRLYKQLFEMEYATKTGNSPFTMKESLEIWITEI